jgi:nucleotide-binding universal stress UspA family protein
MKRILCAVDGSPASDAVVAAAVEIAKATGGRIRLLQVFTTVPELPPTGLLRVPIAPSSTDILRRIREELRDLELSIPEELREGVVVKTGGAADTICREAKEYDADLVVIGAHRYGKLARALGTNAAKVVNSLDRPVLVVRPLRRRE